MSKTKIETGSQKGPNNSQFGTIWINNGYDNKKIRKEMTLEEGWRLGKVPKLKLTKIINLISFKCQITGEEILNVREYKNRKWNHFNGRILTIRRISETFNFLPVCRAHFKIFNDATESFTKVYKKTVRKLRTAYKKGEIFREDFVAKLYLICTDHFNALRPHQTIYDISMNPHRKIYNEAVEPFHIAYKMAEEEFYLNK